MAQDDTFNLETRTDVKKYLYTVYTRRYILASIVAAIMVVDIIVTLLQTPIYKATGLILIEKAKSGMARPAQEAVTTDMSDVQYYNTQYGIIKSRSLAERVAIELKLDSIKDFQDNALSPAEVLQKMITVEPVKSSRLVQVSVEYKNPEMAAQMVNVLSRLYVEQNTENMLYMAKEILKTFPGSGNMTAQDIAAGGTDGASKEDISSLLPSIMGSKILEDLKSQKIAAETELATLSRRYKEKHPAITELQNKIEQLNLQIQAESSNNLGSVKASLAGLFLANNIRVFEYASVPKQPFKPNKPLNILIGLAISLSVGVGFIFAMELTDDTVKNEEDVKKYLGIPYMGSMPVLSDAESQDPAIMNKNLDAMGAVKSIKTNIIFSAPKGPPNTILITSTVPGEGKTMMAASLAYSFSKAGVKTLIIDADMHRSRHHSIFKVGDRAPGLSDLLINDSLPDKVIRKAPYDNLYIITSGSPTSKSVELISSEKTKNILAELSKKFDKIIIDTPPSFNIADALVLSRICDMVVVVIKSGVVDWETLKEMEEKFTTVGSKINGVIINYLDIVKDSYYHHKYSEYCKHYYSNNPADNGRPVAKKEQ